MQSVMQPSPPTQRPEVDKEARRTEVRERLLEMIVRNEALRRAKPR